MAVEFGPNNPVDISHLWQLLRELRGETLHPLPHTVSRDWELMGEGIDAVLGDPEGSFLARAAERLNQGLPTKMTSTELKAATADAVARARVRDGLGPSLTLEEITTRAAEMDNRQKDL